MRAIIVMPLADQRGGAELMLRQLVGFTSEVKWTVAFLESGPMVSEFQDLGVASHVLQAKRLRNVATYVATVHALARLIREQRAEIVVGWMTKAQLYAGPAAFLARVPAVWYRMETPSRTSPLDRLATALPAKLVIAVSAATGREQARLFPARPIRVVYPGVELDRFDPDRLPPAVALREELGLPTDIPIIGIFGRLQEWKGMHVLIEAMPRVLEQHPDARCVVVGGIHALEPDYRGRLTDLIDRLGIGEQVVLAGPQSNVPAWMNAVDVVVHASRNEPFGIVLIEAMALGKPLVAGAEGGPAEVIAHGVNGLLVPYGDVPALAACLVRLLNDRGFAKRLGEAARERARDFSIERHVEALQSAVRDAATGAN
jgi:glycosyltransferase involved in cell wall biosynthesis